LEAAPFVVVVVIAVVVVVVVVVDLLAEDVMEVFAQTLAAEHEVVEELGH